MHKPSLSDVVAAESHRLLALPGVVGVAEGSDHGTPCIVVYVAPDDSPTLPSKLEGHTVVVRPSGPIKAR